MFNTMTLSTNQSERFNMNKLPNHALATVAFLSALLCLVGCQSNPQPKNAGANADLRAIAAKQKEYDQLLEEWKTLKPGLSRLLSIEGELNLLLGQLEQLSTSLEESQGPTAIASGYSQSATPEPQTAPQPVLQAVPLPADAELVTAPIAMIPSEPEATAYTDDQDFVEKETTTASNANFSLQVASITDMRRLPQIWQEMIDKNPQLLANLEPNFQKTNVRNTDYYRLKVGGFSTQQEASRKCSELKMAGVSCIVADYTSSNFAQLANYNETSLAAQNLLNRQGN
jgi:cell division protein FtsN